MGTPKKKRKVPCKKIGNRNTRGLFKRNKNFTQYKKKRHRSKVRKQLETVFNDESIDFNEDDLITSTPICSQSSQDQHENEPLNSSPILQSAETTYENAIVNFNCSIDGTDFSEFGNFIDLTITSEQNVEETNVDFHIDSVVVPYVGNVDAEVDAIPDNTSPSQCTITEVDNSHVNAGTTKTGKRKKGTSLEEIVKEYKYKICADNFIDLLLHILGEAGLLRDFFILLDCLRNGKLSVNNIAFLCCLDRALYANLDNATQMRYREATLAFWECVYRFAGGGALRLLGGPEHRGQVKFGLTGKSVLPPILSLCNFKIPSIPTLNKASSLLGKCIKPGFMEDIMKSIPKDRQYILAFDGKSLVPGIDRNGNGQVDLWGFEGPHTRQRLEARLRSAYKILQLVQDGEIAYLPALIQVGTFRIKELRHLRAKLEMCKMRWEKMCGNNPTMLSKYSTAFSQLTVNLHSCKSLIQGFLECNRELCNIMACVHTNEHNFVDGKLMVPTRQGNFFRLLPPDKLKSTFDILGNHTFLCKQGTPEWHTLRDIPLITGSTLHNGLGLGTGVDLHEHYKEYVKKTVVNGVRYRKKYSREEMINMNYGKTNESNGLATLVGTIMPAYLPKCFVYKEVGSFFDGPDGNSRLLMVSPDGQLKCAGGACNCKDVFNFATENAIAVEVKCPVPKEKYITDIHYTIPIYYLLQVTAEMHVLEATKCWYICYTKESTTLIEIKFLPDLWEKVWKLIQDMYVEPKYHKRPPEESKQLKAELEAYAKEACVLLCEVPSLEFVPSPIPGNGTLGAFGIVEINYSKPTAKNIYMCRLASTCAHLKELIKDCYTMHQSKATDLVTFVLSDIDRMADKGLVLNFPIAYGLSDSSFKVPVMRRMLDTVRNRLKADKIDVLCEAYDGQWHRVMVRSRDGLALTYIQACKDIFNWVCTKSKQELVKELLKFSCVSKSSLEEWKLQKFKSGIFSNGNIVVEKKPGSNAIYIESDGGIVKKKGFMKDMMVNLGHRHPTLWNVKMQSKKTRHAVVQDFQSVLDYLPPEIIALCESNQDTNEDNPINVEEIADHEVGNEKSSRAPTTKSNPYFNHGKLQNIQQLFLNDGEVFVTYIIAKLSEASTRTKDKISDMNTQQFLDLLGDSNRLFHTFSIADLKIIELELQYLTREKFFRSTHRKAEMCNIIGLLFGTQKVFDVESDEVKSLKELAEYVIYTQNYPKRAIASAYARTIVDENIQKWENLSTIPMNVPIRHEGVTHKMYCFPEYSSDRQQLEPRLHDPTHLITNVRTSAITKGIPELGVKRQAWLDVSAKFPDILSLGYITSSVEKQSAAVAQAVFSEKVEHAMHKLGYHMTAFFVQHIRKFFQACDKKHLSADTRVTYLLEVHHYFMHFLDKKRMPPAPFNTILGLSCTTFEGILQNCSIRILLYKLSNTNTYNPRAAGTLMVESLYGELTCRDPTRTGNIRAIHVESLWHDILVLFKHKHDPDKSFHFQTAAHNIYPVQMADCRPNDFNVEDSTKQFRDHPFDLPDTTGNKKRKRKTKITSDMRPLCGTQPLRKKCKYSLDESTISPVIRSNLTEEQIKFAHE